MRSLIVSGPGSRWDEPALRNDRVPTLADLLQRFDRVSPYMTVNAAVRLQPLLKKIQNLRGNV